MDVNVWYVYPPLCVIVPPCAFGVPGYLTIAIPPLPLPPLANPVLPPPPLPNKVAFAPFCPIPP